MSDLADKMVEAAAEAVYSRVGVYRDWETLKKYWPEQAENRRAVHRTSLIGALEELNKHHGEVLVADIITELKETKT